MNKRDEQITKAAKNLVVNSVDSAMDEETAWYYGFINGANWADANPVKHSVEICTEINQKLERDNAVLVKALKYYANADHYKERKTMGGIRQPGVLAEGGSAAREALEGDE